MKRPLKITLPLIIDHSDYNTKIMLGKPPFLVLASLLLVFCLAIFFKSVGDQTISTIEYIQIGFLVITFSVLPVLTVTAAIYLLLLNYVFVSEQEVKFTRPTGFPKKKVILKRSDIKKIVVKKRITTYKSTGGDPFKLVGTFMKLVIIDNNGLQHQVTPEVFSNEGKFPKYWDEFLTKLSKATGLIIEESIETAS